MSEPPRLTDLAALARNRRRAREEALFLQTAAAEELQDRLSLVNKGFTVPAIVTPFPELWEGFLPESQIAADAEVLGLERAAHDVVLHALGLHWANDPLGQIIQCRNALRPDGLFLAAALGGQSLHELRACLAMAETELTGGLSPRVLPMADTRDFGALLQRAGLALPVADSLTLTASYADAWALMRDLRAMGEGNALSQRLRHPTRRRVFERAAEIYAEHFSDPAGRVVATFEMILLTGWVPDPSQPQPLRPGSAQTRLAEALGTREQPVSD